MSSFKFKVGEPRKVVLAFDSPKEGTNSYGAWYLYGIKSGINDDEDSFFATPSLHTMIQTLGAGEGDDITIEKCEEGEITFFKVNGLTLNEMNSGGSAERIKEASPTPREVDRLKTIIKELESELSVYKNSKEATDADIPF